MTFNSMLLKFSQNIEVIKSKISTKRRFVLPQHPLPKKPTKPSHLSHAGTVDLFQSFPGVTIREKIPFSDPKYGFFFDR
jgi:hypothetical protein